MTPQWPPPAPAPPSPSPKPYGLSQPHTPDEYELLRLEQISGFGVHRAELAMPVEATSHLLTTTVMEKVPKFVPQPCLDFVSWLWMTDLAPIPGIFQRSV